MSREYIVMVRHLSKEEAKLLSDIVELPTFPPTLFEYATVQTFDNSDDFEASLED